MQVELGALVLLLVVAVWFFIFPRTLAALPIE